MTGRLTLQSHPTFTETVLHRLQANKIFSTSTLLEHSTERLCAITKLSYRDITCIKDDIRMQFGTPLQNGLDACKEYLQNMAIITTGMDSVDVLMHGGFLTGRIYELSGFPASGKSLFCLNLIKHLVKEYSLQVVYIDTKGDFNPIKLKELLQTVEENEEHILLQLSRVVVKRVTDKFELVNALYEIQDQVASGVLQLRVVIIDSLPSALYSCADYARNDEVLVQISDIMRVLSAKLHIAILVTNSIRIFKQGDLQEAGMVTQTVECGKYWQTVPHTRLRIERKSERFEMVLASSYDVPRSNEIAVVYI